MENKPNILVMYFNFDACALVGVTEVLKHMESIGYINLKHKRMEEVNNADIEEADILVNVRGFDDRSLNIVRRCKELGKYNIYYLDDNLLDIPSYACSYSIFSNKITQETIYNTMRLSDTLWSVNPNIAALYGKYFSKAIVNDAPALLFDESNDISFNRTTDKITIGFSGGYAHAYTTDTILDKPIGIILDKYRNSVNFEIFGAMPKIIGKYKLNHIAYRSNHEEYRAVMKALNWDIGLAPLEKIPFTGCKYFNKFLDYSAVGAAGIYTNADPYTFVVQNGENGILADNTTEAWVEALSYLIENQDERNKIRRNAYMKIKNEFTLDKVAEKIIKNMPEIISYKAK